MSNLICDEGESIKITPGNLTLNDYQGEAFSTAIYPDKGKGNVEYPILGLVGEAGELANAYKKVLRDNGGALTHERQEQLVAELGDVLWYVATLAVELNVPLSYVAKTNLEKLKSRQSRGALGGSGDKR